MCNFSTERKHQFAERAGPASQMAAKLADFALTVARSHRVERCYGVSAPEWMASHGPAVAGLTTSIGACSTRLQLGAVAA